MATPPFFKAVSRNPIGTGSASELVSWLEKYINIIRPDNGIDYWANDVIKGKLPDTGCTNSDLHHVACYVIDGTSEGDRIEVKLVLQDGSFLSLASIKSFAGKDECWIIARAISEVLDSILVYKEVPEIVDMSRKVPRWFSHDSETNLKEMITIWTTPTSLKVSTESGIVLDERDWSVTNPGNATWFVEPRAKDWETVLSRMKANFKVASSVVKQDETVVPGLYKIRRP